MTAQGNLNTWRAGAAKLPVPRWHGERCVSPGGIYFQVEAYGPFVAWMPCRPGWTPVMLPFRETRVL